MNTIDKITLIYLPVSDISESKTFFTDILGFTIVADYEQEGGRWVTLVPAGGEPTITLSSYAEDVPPAPLTIHLSTSDADAAYADVKARGGTPNNEVSDDSWGKWFSIDDPTGNHWYVVQAKSWG
jgi:predicted enzyme related to lactoylglutathione lyase